jgi:predicted transcriptional regulator
MDLHQMMPYIMANSEEYPELIYDMCSGLIDKQLRDLCKQVPNLNDILTYWTMLKDYNMFGVQFSRKPDEFANLTWQQIYELISQPDSMVINAKYLEELVNKFDCQELFILIYKLSEDDPSYEAFEDRCKHDPKFVKNLIVDNYLSIIIGLSQALPEGNVTLDKMGSLLILHWSPPFITNLELMEFNNANLEIITPAERYDFPHSEWDYIGTTIKGNYIIKYKPIKKQIVKKITKKMTKKMKKKMTKKIKKQTN